MRRQVGIIAVVLCALAAAPAAAPATPCVTALSCGTGLDAMLDLEAKAADHMHVGYMVPADFATAAQTPGDVVHYSEYYDSGLWTGVYLAGESFRYATAKHYLADPGLSAADAAFWGAQKSEALARVQTIVAMYDRNVNIAAAYRPAPSSLGGLLSPVTSALGAGAITQGEKGMLMRACTPVGDPLGISPTEDHVLGPLPWKDGKRYYCLENTSRDTYNGTIYGLLTAFDFVAVDDPAMRHTIAGYLLTLADFLDKYQWFYPRPWNAGEALTNPSDYLDPLFVINPGPQLNVATAAKHVADVDGPPAEKLKWDTIQALKVVEMGPVLAPSTEFDALMPAQQYYKWNLGHLVGFNLTRLLGPVERNFATLDLAAMANVTGQHMNAHFEAIDYAASGEPALRDAAIAHLLQWLDYRRNTSGGAIVHNSSKCGVSITCVPEDHSAISLDGGRTRTTIIAGSSATLRDADPLPIADRVPTDFLWQRQPGQLDGSQPATHRTPGIDYLSPYWMLRYYTEVAPPPLRPLPTWPGPLHY